MVIAVARTCVKMSGVKFALLEEISHTSCGSGGLDLKVLYSIVGPDFYIKCVSCGCKMIGLTAGTRHGSIGMLLITEIALLYITSPVFFTQHFVDKSLAFVANLQLTVCTRFIHRLVSLTKHTFKTVD